MPAPRRARGHEDSMLAHRSAYRKGWVFCALYN